MEMPQGYLPDFLKKLIGIDDKDDDNLREVVGPLDKDEAEMYNNACSLKEKANEYKAKTSTAFDLFWATIRSKRGLEQAHTLYINKSTGLIEKSIDTED